ncbi:MAG TPA: hypothetical protein H9815_01285 [Candidatus Ruania gallistercoris]|uniref:Uncharacterized protein n=1 Tax=Candidatus Ruania gallistercoris TaxID=2838746 RepID=A0A9D2EBS9_9MICO|nr:hypothetical protein [Candidatus Ruania gallistercoris]
MSTDNTESVVESRLREILDKRMSAVRELVNAEGAVDDAQAALTAAQDEHKKAWNRALARGWTEQELRKVNLRKPAPKRTRRTTPARPNNNAPRSEPPQPGS